MNKRIDPRTPILVGGGQFTQRTAKTNLLASLNPIGMLAEASQRALSNAGSQRVVNAIDTVSVVRFIDMGSLTGSEPNGVFRNPPQSLARMLGANPRRCFYTATGGHTPQWLVNRTAEEIADGECEVALLAGAESLASSQAAMKQGVDLGWGRGPVDDPGSDPTQIGQERIGFSDYELRHELYLPVNVYPLFENALRKVANRSPAEHLKWLGEFFSPFTRVASRNTYSWFPTFRTPEEISTPTDQNRFIGYPYTKYLNAFLDVDMSAAVVMMSVAKAREFQIPEHLWVYLLGCADANDLWHVTQRINYYSSPAMHCVAKKAFEMAGIDVAALSYIDLYSCFPSAVEIACKEFGIATDDRRGLTVTGGLPYFGGAGNNYVMHSIVEMMSRLRASPGKYGLCTGNGWYVTKHSAGIYSTTPRQGAWQRGNSASYQKELDAMTHPEIVEKPNGKATVETFTVACLRDRRRIGIVIGRLEGGQRFVAHVPDSEEILDMMMREEIVGRNGRVTPGNVTNLFRFE